MVETTEAACRSAPRSGGRQLGKAKPLMLSWARVPTRWRSGRACTRYREDDPGKDPIQEPLLVGQPAGQPHADEASDEAPAMNSAATTQSTRPDSA